jgi:hypothetical protein
MHPGRVEPDEERLLVGHGLVEELLGGGKDLAVDRFHALPGERPGVVDLLATPAVGPRVEYAPRSILLSEFGILRVVIGLRLLLRVQMVEVAQELVEGGTDGDEGPDGRAEWRRCLLAIAVVLKLPPDAFTSEATSIGIALTVNRHRYIT